MSGLRLAGATEVADLASFLGRLVALDPGGLARLRASGQRVTAYARLPFGVLVSRTVAGSADPGDVTVGARDLLPALEAAGGPRALSAGPGGPAPADRAGDPPGRPVADGGAVAVVTWPRPRDVEWRAALPPVDGWLRLDSVPGDVVRALVRAGREALRAVPAGAAAAAGESLLDHESLTVSGAGRTAAVPLRVLGALTRMGFLGEAAEPVVVSAAPGWTRVAAAYGSAYQRSGPGLALTPR